MSTSPVRTVPHQDRSAESIECILDAAEAAFDELGVAAATVSNIANRAGVSVGRVYYWFETKDAIARGLASRNERLVVDLFASLLVDNEAISTPDLVASIVERTLRAIRSNPSVLLQLSMPSSPDDPTGASQLGSVVHAGVAALIAGRVPDTDDAEARIVAATVVNTVVAGARTISSAAADTADAMVTELVYLLCAYLACRFPATDHPHNIVSSARPASPGIPVPEHPIDPFLS